MFHATPHPWLVTPDTAFDAAHAPTRPPKDAGSEKDWKKQLERERDDLRDAQHVLYAHDRYAVLVILQGLDASGKDSAVRHVFKGVNPTGLHVVSFKQPSSTELEHDFLWRTTRQLPERGSIGVFNRSYYEEVLVVRVHPKVLEAERLPHPPDADVWQERFQSIVDHERHLARSGTVILKFWLNVSADEQRRRFLERIREPDKHWKFQAGDVREREHWDAYMSAFGECLAATSKPWAPWYAIPADEKGYLHWQIASAINAALGQLKLAYPKASAEELAALAEAARQLSS